MSNYADPNEEVPSLNTSTSLTIDTASIISNVVAVPSVQSAVDDGPMGTNSAAASSSGSSHVAIAERRAAAVERFALFDGSSNVPALDSLWASLRGLVYPYEEDRRAYRFVTSLHRRTIVFDSLFWRQLVLRVTPMQRVLDILLLLGFTPTGVDDVEQWVAMIAKHPFAKVRFRYLFLDTAAAGGRSVTFDESAGPTSLVGAAESGQVSSSSEREDEDEELPDDGQGTSSGVACSAERNASPTHSVSSNVLAPPPADCSVLSTSSNNNNSSHAAASRVRDLENEVRELTRQLRLLRSRDVSAVESPTGASLTSSAAPTAAPSTPIPQIVLQGRTLVASTSGNTVICLPLNYLDPDKAPFVVSLSTHVGLQMIPCSIVEHRFVLFVAPAQPRGSHAVSLMCTSSDGTLKRYTRSVWLEYRHVDSERTPLSHHAVNQLMQDVPLPSSASVFDPMSENATNDIKSEVEIDAVTANGEEDDDDVVGDDDDVVNDDDDDNDGADDDADDDDYSVGDTTLTDTTTGPVGDGILSSVAAAPQHLPLTREMLEMIPFSVYGAGVPPPVLRALVGGGGGGGPPPRPPSASHTYSRASVAPSEGTEPAASSIAPTTHLHHHDAVSASVASVVSDGGEHNPRDSLSVRTDQ